MQTRTLNCEADTRATTTVLSHVYLRRIVHFQHRAVENVEQSMTLHVL